MEPLVGFHQTRRVVAEPRLHGFRSSRRGVRARTAAMAADRMNINRSWEHIQQKYVGTGHVDMSKFEWASNVHRDSIASHVGHADRLLYFSVAQGESVGRVRYELLEKMLQPCGPPPE